jgi:phycocyanobilin:ferredoxin oxidoreductase
MLVGGREAELREVHAACVRYSEQQLRNSKTKVVLEQSFGSAFAERYMSELMFDVEAL